MNLLDNSDFRNSVNQRRYVNGTALAAGEYFIDRWKANYAGMTASISANGISVSDESSIRQVLDKKYTDIYLGKTLTLAVKSAAGEYAVCSAVLTNPGTYVTLTSAGVFGWFALDIDSNGNINIVRKPSSGKVVEWAALYEGSYTAETLPPYVPKGYAAELAECLRYYYLFENKTNGFYFPCLQGSTQIPGFLFPVPMRVKPTCTITRLSVWDTRGFTDVMADINSENTSTGGLLYIQLNTAFPNAGLISLNAEFSADL